MVTSLAGSSLIAPKKKRVLLLDTSRLKRDLRSETMRKLGADVDCAADVSEARSWWRPDLYDLVLIHDDTDQAQTDRFCEEMRKATPAQQIMFLVGKPGYLAASPIMDQADASASAISSAEDELSSFVQSSPPTNGKRPTNSSPPLGILEACRRISAVRSAADARSQAIRDRPAPLRDSEGSRPIRDPREGLDALLTEFRERDQK
jgi:CheY-like chemotaxis protein